jgi:hypothetical protein
VRGFFGVESFGVNAFEVHAGELLVVPHDELGEGEHQEELYLIVEGRARERATMAVNRRVVGSKSNPGVQKRPANAGLLPFPRARAMGLGTLLCPPKLLTDMSKLTAIIQILA